MVSPPEIVSDPLDLDTFETYWMRQFRHLLNSGNGPDEPTELGRAIIIAIKQALKQ